VNILSDAWFGDLMLIDASFVRYKCTDLRAQLIFSVPDIIDSIKEKESNIFLKEFTRTSVQPDYKSYLDYFFVKKQGKWFLTNLNNPSVFLNETGFDSVYTAGKNSFVGYLNGKFSYYALNKKSDQIPDMDFEFPNYGDVTRVVCKNSVYEMKKYQKQDTAPVYDDMGNILRDSVIHYTIEIPYVKTGKFNLINEKNELVLQNWADEIRVPVPNINDNFSITDTTSSVYNPISYQSAVNWPLFNEYHKSIALKYGTKWRLTTIQKQDNFLDGFEDVKFIGEFWEATKEGRKYLYSISGLKLKE
jgi:hypothetical protein